MVNSAIRPASFRLASGSSSRDTPHVFLLRPGEHGFKQSLAHCAIVDFEIDDFDAAVGRAAELKTEIVLPRHRNPPDGNGGPNHWEIWLRDPDGYTVVLASPDGSADGNWRPRSLR